MATRITNKLPQFISKVQEQAIRSVGSALVLGSSEASALTPIDTSTLLNSQTRDVSMDGAKVVGSVSYTAEYALPVHDPDNPQTFRRATAEKSFLTKGFEQAEPAIRAAIIAGLKV